MAYYNGKQGRWITTDTGRHVFIEDGQSIEEALANAFDESESETADTYEPEFDHEDLTPEINRIENEKRMKSFRGIWDAENARMKNHFKEQFLAHPIVNPELEDVIMDMVAKKVNVQRIWIRPQWTKDPSVYYSYGRKLFVNINADDAKYGKTMSNLFHELGHGLDNNGTGNYHSSQYISKKYGMTLADMIKKEMLANESRMDEIFQIYDDIDKENDRNWERKNAGEITEVEYRNEKARIYEGTYLSICDVVQGTYGLEYVKNKFFNYTHPAEYFDWKSEKYPEAAEKHNARNRGTELFAELTENLTCDHEQRFANFIKKYAPKSYEIYFEILKEVYGYGKR